MQTYTELLLGDCLERMWEIPEGSVDMVLTDPPYGTTACKWDAVVPFEPMWTAVRRVLRPNGAAVFTASQPFTSALVMSNIEWFKYEWVWEKSRVGGFWDCKFRPLKAHENVVVFSTGGCANGSIHPMVYNPQDLAPGKGSWTVKPVSGNSRTGSQKKGRREASGYPRTVLRFGSETKPVHPTQKPVTLMEYLIRTYTKGGETVLDFTMGSGTTGVACINTGRNFIGIEKDPEYFKVAEDRINRAKALEK